MFNVRASRVCDLFVHHHPSHTETTKVRPTGGMGEDFASKTLESQMHISWGAIQNLPSNPFQRNQIVNRPSAGCECSTCTNWAAWPEVGPRCRLVLTSSRKIAACELSQPGIQQEHGCMLDGRHLLAAPACCHVEVDMEGSAKSAPSHWPARTKTVLDKKRIYMCLTLYHVQK